MTKADHTQKDNVVPPRRKDRLDGGATRRRRSYHTPPMGGMMFLRHWLSGVFQRGLSIRAMAAIGGSVFALLLVIAGVSAWVGRTPQGVPVIGPPPYAVKDRPADPGGMMVMGDDTAKSDITGRGAVHLAPPPELPDARILAGRVANPPSWDVTQRRDFPAQTQPKAVPNEGASTVARSEQTVASVAPSAHVASNNVAKSAPKPPEKQADSDVPVPSTHPVVSITLPPPPSPEGAHAPEAGPHNVVAVHKEATQQAKGHAAGGYEVQLAALGSEDEARDEWQELKQKLPNLLGQREPLFEAVERNGRQLIRLRLGGFADRQAARLFCVRLHAQSQACSVATF